MDEDRASGEELEGWLDLPIESATDASPAERVSGGMRQWFKTEPRYHPGVVAVAAVFTAASLTIAAYAYAGATASFPGGVFGAGSIQNEIEIAIEWTSPPFLSVGLVLTAVLLWWCAAGGASAVRRVRWMTTWGIVLGFTAAVAGVLSGIVSNTDGLTETIGGRVTSVLLTVAEVILGLATAAVSWQAYWACKPKEVAMPLSEETVT